MLVVPDESNFINQYLTELSSRSVRFGQDYTARNLPKPLKIKVLFTIIIKDEKPHEFFF